VSTRPAGALLHDADVLDDLNVRSLDELPPLEDLVPLIEAEQPAVPAQRL